MSSLAVDPSATEPADRSAMVHIDDVVRVFGRGDGQVRALDGVTLSMARGTFTAIMGPSGSGKSTLLQIAAGLDRPTQGTRSPRRAASSTSLNERALARLRRERIGFVFQSFNLLGALTAEQNVALPARLAGKRLRRSVVRDVLERVGPRRAARPPAGPDVGRPAAAGRDRARPRRRAQRDVRRRADWRARHARRAAPCWRSCARRSTRRGGTLVMVTHDPSAAAWADRVVFMADGRLAGELHAPTAEQVAERLTGLGA